MSELMRTNRVSVQAEGEGFVATFYRTHKTVGVVRSVNTDWAPAEGMNKTAQREAFRQWVCDNASIWGMTYDPADRRTDSNRVPARYDSDDTLLQTASNLVRDDIEAWVHKCVDEWNLPMCLSRIEGDSIEPMTTSTSGKPVNAKYANGNWAWAKVGLAAVVTVLTGDEPEEVYLSMTCSLVSGQLKKPVAIGQHGYNYTGVKAELEVDVKQYIPAKEAQDTTGKAEQPKEEIPTEEKPADVPAKKRGRKSKKDAQQ